MNAKILVDGYGMLSAWAVKTTDLGLLVFAPIGGIGGDIWHYVGESK